MLKDIALDEANHAVLFAELNGMISASTKENLEKMLSGEKGLIKPSVRQRLKPRKREWMNLTITLMSLQGMKHVMPEPFRTC